MSDKKTVAGSHHPGQAIYRAILSEDIEWKPFPAFPPEARLAVIVGEPLEPEPYVVRVKVPRGVKLMPHKHSEDRVYTVISGVFYIGLGDQFDDDRRFVRVTASARRPGRRPIWPALPTRYSRR